MLILGEPVNKETGTSPNLASEATVGVGISPGIGCAITLTDNNRKVIVAVACRYAVVFIWEGVYNYWVIRLLLKGWRVSVHVEFIRNHIRPARDAQGILAVWKTGTTEREGEPTANIV